MTPLPARALIAEDEPLLAAALQHELARAWPALQVVASVGDGLSAVREALALAPDVLFFDIRMPGLSGLDAAVELADHWPTAGPPARPFPALVFVTAYDEYAVQAFEAQAVDYLLKPVAPARLHKTVQKLQHQLSTQGSAAAEIEATMERLRALLLPLAPPAAAGHNGTGLEPPPPAGQPTATHGAPATRLTLIQASSGPHIHMVPVADVQVFEAADKYVRVLTATREYLIRTPLKELIGQLDPAVFWQIHRSTLVRADAITTIDRDASGRLHLHLAGRTETLPVSRLYAPRFKAM